MIVYQFLHARFPMFESRVSCAIEHLAVGCVLTGIRPTSYEERQCVNRRKTAPRVVGCLRLRSMSVISHTVQNVRNLEIGHLCYMATLKNELPRSDVLFVFYDCENTQDTKFSDSAREWNL